MKPLSCALLLLLVALSGASPPDTLNSVEEKRPFQLLAIDFDVEAFKVGFVEGIFGWTLPLIREECWTKFTNLLGTYRSFLLALRDFSFYDINHQLTNLF